MRRRATDMRNGGLLTDACSGCADSYAARSVDRTAAILTKCCERQSVAVVARARRRLRCGRRRGHDRSARCAHELARRFCCIRSASAQGCFSRCCARSTGHSFPPSRKLTTGRAEPLLVAALSNLFAAFGAAVLLARAASSASSSSAVSPLAYSPSARSARPLHICFSISAPAAPARSSRRCVCSVSQPIRYCSPGCSLVTGRHAGALPRQRSCSPASCSLSARPASKHRRAYGCC